MKCAGKPHMRNHLSLKPFPSHLHLYKPLMRNYPSSKTVSETFLFTPSSSHLHFDKPLMETTPLPRLSLKPFPSHLHLYKPQMRNHPLPRLSLKPFPSHLHLYKPRMRNHPLPRLSLKPFPSHLHLHNRHSFETTPSPQVQVTSDVYVLFSLCKWNWCLSVVWLGQFGSRVYEKTGGGSSIQHVSVVPHVSDVQLIQVWSDMYQFFSWCKLDPTCIGCPAAAS